MPSALRAAQDLGLKSSILCMRPDRWWECDAVHTKCSDLIDSAAVAKWRGGGMDGKHDGCKGEVTADVGDITSSHT